MVAVENASLQDIYMVIINMQNQMNDMMKLIYSNKEELKAEIAELRTEIADVRKELADTKAELKEEIADVRKELVDTKAELKAEIADVRKELADTKAELKEDIANVRNELKEVESKIVSEATDFMQTDIIKPGDERLRALEEKTKNCRCMTCKNYA